MKDIKRFRVLPNVGIIDGLTGKIYTNNNDIVKLLNNLSDESDKNAELYHDLKFTIMELIK